MIRSICRSILLVILRSFRVTSINLEVWHSRWFIVNQASSRRNSRCMPKSASTRNSIFTFKIKLEIFGTSRIDLALNDQQKLNINLHHFKVKENREKLKILIKGICFLIDQELPFRGNCESAHSFNCGN